MSPKLKIGLLVAVHVVAGLFLGWANQDNGPGNSPSFVGLYALVFAQAGLLGIWGALGTTQPLWRLPAVIATTGYLSALAITAEAMWQVRYAAVELTLFVAFPTAVVFLLLSILCYSRYKLHFARPSLPNSMGGQVTIRQLLLATAAVAVVLAIGREVRKVSPGDWIETECMIVTHVTLCLIAVDFAVSWGTLGTRRPMPRLAIILPGAFLVGVIPTYFLETLLSLDWKDHVTWSCIMGFQATIMAASLLVIRSCGWRLVRGDRNEAETLPTPPGS